MMCITYCMSARTVVVQFELQTCKYTGQVDNHMDCIRCWHACYCRLVADLAAQLLALGPWKTVYEQLAAINSPWFEQHSVANQLKAQPGAVPGGAPAPVPAAIAVHNKH